MGDMLQLRDLRLNNNSLRMLPYELGRLFQLQNLVVTGKLASLYTIHVHVHVHCTYSLLMRANKLETALSRDRLACLAPLDMVFSHVYIPLLKAEDLVSCYVYGCMFCMGW